MAMVWPTEPLSRVPGDKGGGRSGVYQIGSILDFWDDCGCEKTPNIGSWQAKGGVCEVVDGEEEVSALFCGVLYMLVPLEMLINDDTEQLHTALAFYGDVRVRSAEVFAGGIIMVSEAETLELGWLGLGVVCQ